MRVLLPLVLSLTSCARPVPGPPLPAPDPAPTAHDSVPASPSATVEAPSVTALPYPWLGDRMPDPVAGLSQRFAAPPGFARVDLAPGSFGAWLRTLPLLPRGTPVRSYRGGVVLPPERANLAAVVDLDVGDGDLQQCADSVIRLHAEWLFAQGRRDASYRAASGTAMPFARWARGERMLPEGIAFRWAPSARPDDGHAAYRRWLSGVFAWANTVSLARDTEPVAAADLRPGDFVVQPGGPGHAVLVLDLARGPGGRRALLLGQGFMPAQSFHVLRPAGAAVSEGRAPWFVVEPGDLALDTPFWAPFPWKTLHRFAGT